ncbi:PIN domain-containing protein [Clostridium beijerinckii]|uniref:Nucleic acid-binding protein n=1 Tax=Clostridium beijerinckii TaxID=1520 RepID=A0AAX0AXC1_CLOBE|nr:PIN domain-containing protein [Clostridium beijerinckii]NRT87284.1 putative nucleic acid-binding protein [Clostridium beijerinckii]NYC72715.1 putative nucleic acid-binding protein [Clostridium beijerinckii]
MKYLMVDTNIYIDMVVSRNGNHKADSFNQLMKLLEYNEVKLIVPKIVITEVFRHISNEIDKVGKSINEMKSKAKGLYWINHIDELERFNRNLNPVRVGINSLAEEFDKNREKYKDEYKNLFNQLFNNNNSIILEETQDIIFKAAQRQVHKLRPYHYGGDSDKDCLADSIIIETLINIEEFIDINTDDKIYFISRNPADFSDDKDKNLLHSDISVDLESKGLLERFNYSLLFTKTLLGDFKDEIRSAGLTEQLELEAEYEWKEAIRESYYVQEDNERESVGLSSLSSDYEQKLSELNETNGLIDLLEEMREEIQNKCEELEEQYSCLEETIRGKSFEELQMIIEDNSLIRVMIGKYSDEDDIIDEIICFINWVIGDEDYSEFAASFKNEDCFGLNTTLATFSDLQNNNYVLETSGYLEPRNDDDDTIEILIYKGDNLLEKGDINVYYGYINFNDDGNVGDGAEESITFDIDKIIGKLLEIKDSIINDLDYRILKANSFVKLFS